ncbi:MAG: lytic murein transglycosylase [Roseovarius sp.]
MSSKWIMAGIAAAGIFGNAAWAEAVERSLRPKARVVTPSDAEQAQVAVASRGGLRVSLRPQVRPALMEASEPADLVRASSRPAAFESWIRSFRGRALAQGISPAVFDAAFRNVGYNADVVSKDRNQAEFKNEIWDYLDNAASPPRVSEGQSALRRHRGTLNRLESAYGVEAHVVTAVWGLESRYGTRMGDYPIIEALATLAFDGRRGKFFESQLIAALKILQSGDVRLGDFTGSWAGAMGHTQFIPTSYLAFAVDYTGDGKRDIWSRDPSDALASTAAYLRRSGWVRGMPWGVEVRVPQGLSSTGGSRMPSQWAQLGVVGMDGRPVRDFGSARLLLPAGRGGAAFLVFKNFDVIKRYNNSDAYALGVGHLSDRIAGGAPIQTAWPRGYTPISFDEKMELQRRLKRKGYPLEKIDGLVGPNTREAIAAYQRSVGMRPDGNASREVLESLRRR